MTLKLFIDTTLSGASLALVSDKTWFGFHEQRGDADSAICRMLDEGLQKLAKKTEDIDTIVVSHGPGSFTGIKVGLAWAYGFQASKKQNLLVGMSSLAEGNAEIQVHYKQSKVALLLPISRREAFLCWQDKEKEFHFSSIVLFSAQAELQLKTLASEAFHFYLIAAEEQTKQWMQTISETSAITMLDFMKFAMQGMIRKAGTLDLQTLKQRMVLPQYLKRTTVEEKFLGNQNV